MWRGGGEIPNGYFWDIDIQKESLDFCEIWCFSWYKPQKQTTGGINV